MSSVAIAMPEVPIPHNDAPQRIGVLFAAALLPFLFTLLLTGLFRLVGDYQVISVVPAKTKFASIDYPTRTTSVGPVFIAKGSISKLPPKTSAYLMVKRDDLYWPKKDLGQRSGAWSKPINEAKRKNSRLSLVVLAVNATDKKLIEQWYTTSQKTGKYPGIAALTAAEEIAAIEVRQQ